MYTFDLQNVRWLLKEEKFMTYASHNSEITLI